MVDTHMLMESVKDTSLSPKARIDGIRQSGAMLFEYVGGSIAYGTNVEGSDRDLRGIFCMLPEECLGLQSALPKGSIADDRKIEGQKAKNDDTIYTLKRFFELLKGSNPNVLEALWMPDDCVVSRSPEMDIIIDNRRLFMTRACLGSHFGFAAAQISRASGKNKKVNNPCPKERPKKLGFCHIVACIPGKQPWVNPDVPSASHAPFRPVPLSEMPWVDLSHYHVSSVEHVHGLYRMYYYGEDAKGVFRGDDMLVCESIPMEDEIPRFSGLLVYNESEYEKAVKAWGSYWDWMNHRNEARWIDQEKGKLAFDQKNMMHCVRLLWSGLNIIRNGEPIIRFSGEQLDYLMALRTGKITDYNEVMAKVAGLISEMEEAVKTSPLPAAIDELEVDNLYLEVARMAWARLFKRVLL